MLSLSCEPGGALSPRHSTNPTRCRNCLRSHECIMSGRTFCGDICVGLYWAYSVPLRTVICLRARWVAAPILRLRNRVPEPLPYTQLHSRHLTRLDAPQRTHTLFIFILKKLFLSFCSILLIWRALLARMRSVKILIGDQRAILGAELCRVYRAITEWGTISPWKHGPTRSFAAHIADYDELRNCGEGYFPDNTPRWLRHDWDNRASRCLIVCQSVRVWRGSEESAISLPLWVYGCNTCTTRLSERASCPDGLNRQRAFITYIDNNAFSRCWLKVDYNQLATTRSTGTARLAWVLHMDNFWKWRRSSIMRLQKTVTVHPRATRLMDREGRHLKWLLLSRSTGITAFGDSMKGR
ncbi:hypothetical protein EDB83DRAFT_88377 [Lactarius deliciosus]|nr:hypothetical protein EDB83DRAFT_88377 [Lactarius deliciosus]